MKATIPYKLTNAQKKAADREIDKQIVEREKAWKWALEAMIMWTLHEYAGWGKRKLLDFRNRYNQEYEWLCERYKIEGEYPAMSKLKDIGYDVKALNADSNEKA